jgi:hypothetical protein
MTLIRKTIEVDNANPAVGPQIACKLCHKLGDLTLSAEGPSRLRCPNCYLTLGEWPTVKEANDEIMKFKFLNSGSSKQHAI